MQHLRLCVLLIISFAIIPVAAFAQTDVNIIQFGSTIHIGDRGDRVKVLQTLLASDPTIYPEGLVTGYYGPLTASAVSRYQQAHDLEQVGNVGPKTLVLINAWLRQQESATQTAASNFTQCPVTKQGTTTMMRWPSNVPCPSNTASIVNTTLPVAPAASTSASTTADSGSCLSNIFSSVSSVSEALSEASRCGPQTLPMSQLPADQAADKQTCSLTVGSAAYSFPYPSNYPCPMQAVVGTPANASASSTVDWSRMFPSATNTQCTVRINGRDYVFPWPSTVLCTGTIPGMQ
jgi:hypothetical protein